MRKHWDTQVRNTFNIAFSKYCRNTKTPKFTIIIPNVPLNYIMKFVDPWNHQIVNNEKACLQWDAGMQSFDTKRKGGLCPAWLVSHCLHKKKRFEHLNMKECIRFTYYNCQMQYQSLPVGKLQICGFIMHKSQNSNWQRPV